MIHDSGQFVSQQTSRAETTMCRGHLYFQSREMAEFTKQCFDKAETWVLEKSFVEGYSSLAVALVLPESGLLVACERDAKCLDVAKKYYDLANVSHKVNVKHGLAEDALKSMILNGEAGSYDFAFIDAEKRMYQKYYELLLQLVKIGGLIVIDNVLWHGKVADPMVNDAKTVSIRNFNENIMEDQRVSISMVPIGDGMTICRKK